MRRPPMPRPRRCSWPDRANGTGVARQMGIRFVMLTDDQGRIHMNPAMRDRIELQRDNREVIISEPLT